MASIHKNIMNALSVEYIILGMQQQRKKGSYIWRLLLREIILIFGNRIRTYG